MAASPLVYRAERVSAGIGEPARRSATLRDCGLTRQVNDATDRREQLLALRVAGSLQVHTAAERTASLPAIPEFS